jgi:hypothetical protein
MVDAALPHTPLIIPNKVAIEGQATMNPPNSVAAPPPVGPYSQKTMLLETIIPGTTTTTIIIITIYQEENDAVTTIFRNLEKNQSNVLQYVILSQDKRCHHQYQAAKELDYLNHLSRRKM